MVVLDTNIIIDHLRLPKGSETAFIKVARQRSKDSFAVSIISIQELYQGKSSREVSKTKDILDILNSLQILPYTFDTAKLAGEITRDSTYPIQFADAAIAATTIINSAQLLTLNKKDFQVIKELGVILP